MTLNANATYSYEDDKQTRMPQLAKAVQKELVDSRFTNDMLNPKRSSHLPAAGHTASSKFTTSP